MDDLLKGTIGLSVLVVLAGIIGAAISGSDRAFDLQPFLKPWQARTPAIAPTAQGGPQTPGVSSGTAPSKNLTAQDLLSACPPHSLDPQVGEVPLAHAELVRQRIAANQPFQDLIELQQILGNPNCHYLSDRTHHYRYVVETGKAIDVQQVGDQPGVTITLVHF